MNISNKDLNQYTINIINELEKIDELVIDGSYIIIIYIPIYKQKLTSDEYRQFEIIRNFQIQKFIHLKISLQVSLFMI